LTTMRASTTARRLLRWACSVRRSKDQPISASSTRWRSPCGAMSGSPTAPSAATSSRWSSKVRRSRPRSRTDGPRGARIEAHKADNSPVLIGTASIGPDHTPTELDARRAAQGDPGELFVIDTLEIGQRGADGEVVAMGFTRTTVPRTRSRWPRSSSGSPNPILVHPRRCGSFALGARHRPDGDDQRPGEQVRRELAGALPGPRAVLGPRDPAARRPRVRRAALQRRTRDRRALPEPPHRVLLDQDGAERHRHRRSCGPSSCCTPGSSRSPTPGTRRTDCPEHRVSTSRRGALGLPAAQRDPARSP